jgi:hypothetical protein
MSFMVEISMAILSGRAHRTRHHPGLRGVTGRLN